MPIFKSTSAKVLTALFSIIILLIISIMAFINLAPQFGAPPSGEHLKKIAASDNYSDKEFVNLIETKMDQSLTNIWGMLKEYVSAKHTAPKAKLLTRFEVKKSQKPDSTATITWYGHSAILLEIEGKRIFLDPMLGPSASPVSFFGKRFKNAPAFDLSAIEKLDAVIFSHDHYDHLDYPTVQSIKDKVDHFYTPLGLGSHLVAWGVSAEKITELDWWEHADLGDLTFTATPARHFSGRSIGDNNKTLWASWVIQGKNHQIYFSGDSGYGPHFKEIGERFGPFDFAMMECGQYNERWEAIHMMPEQTVQAALDIRTKKMMPIHWGAFTLAPHEWYEPAERVSKAAEGHDLLLITPEIGATFQVLSQSPTSQWWVDYKN